MGSVRRATWRQYLLYLGLNVIVSALTVILVLSIWRPGAPRSSETPSPTVDVVAQVASRVPTITPTKAPSPTPRTYTVRVGDTLSDIADVFEVDIELLMSTNRIDDPNSLSAGQVIVLPSIEGPDQNVIAATTEPEPEGSDTRGESSSLTVIINGIEGAGDLELESVRLLNQGGEVSMAGWTLSDGAGHRFTFPEFTFYSTGAVEVHTRPGTNTTIDLYWGLNEAVWTSGKQIELRDASGAIQSTFKIPIS
ncbi:MAG: LysM peptidoglycan-binding domain-containing protein [Anaerolineales bacterium]|nr:LysM peptidoglycan-binding domain-containing protein [Anaerolineales bacterium]